MYKGIIIMLVAMLGAAALAAAAGATPSGGGIIACPLTSSCGGPIIHWPVCFDGWHPIVGCWPPLVSPPRVVVSRQEGHAFLCYSRFENDGGWAPTLDVATTLTVVAGPTSTPDEYWQPLMMPGNPPGYPTFGPNHLQCNGGKPTGAYTNYNNDPILAAYAGTLGIVGVGS